MRPFKRGDWYYIDFRHEGRRYYKALKTKRKKDAERKANAYYRRVLAGHPLEDEPERAPPQVAELLADYIADLERRGRTKHHVASARRTIARMLKDAAVETLEDITTPRIERALSFYSGHSPSTQNRSLAYMKAWMRWLNKTGRWDRNPALAIDPVRLTRTKPPRRALTPEQAWALTHDERIPRRRRTIYMLAIGTGLRRNEIKSLEREDIDLERLTVTVQDRNAKNRKTATLPIDSECAELIKAWLAEPYWGYGNYRRKSDRPLPPMPDTRTLRDDLEVLGIPYQTPEGVIDFHALRVTFGTLLERAGESLRMAQNLLRHSTPTLTSNIYTRFESGDRRSAIERVHELLRSHSNNHSKRKREA